MKTEENTPEEVSFENIDDYLDDIIREEREKDKEGAVNPHIHTEALRRYIKPVNNVLEDKNMDVKSMYGSSYFQEKLDIAVTSTDIGSCLKGLSYLSNHLEGLNVEKENERKNGSAKYDFKETNFEKLRELEENIELRELPGEEAKQIEEILKDEGSLQNGEIIENFEEKLGYSMNTTRLKNRIEEKDKIQKTDEGYRYIETKSL